MTSTASPLEQRLNRITQATFSLWWEHKHTQTEEAVPHLTHALTALGKVNAEYQAGRNLLGYLCLTLLKDRVSHVRQDAAEALGKIGSDAALPELLFLLRYDEDFEMREKVVLALGEIGSNKAVPELLNILGNDKFGGVRYAAAEALGKIGSTEAIAGLLHAYNNKVDILDRWEREHIAGG